MKKIIFYILLSFILLGFFIGFIYLYLKYKDEKIIKNAKVEITYLEDLTVEWNSKDIKVSNFIESINGKIVDDYIINTLDIGNKIIEYEYINDENIKLKQSFNIEIVDKIPPIIWVNNIYNISVNSKDNLIDNILCGDNLDNNPRCFIEGNYDLNKIGKYPLIFKAIDKYGNESSKDFTLNVYKPSNTSSKVTKYKYFNDLVKKYKNNNTKIGLDLSEWQDYPDYDKLKNAGVEFVILRVGSTKGRTGDYFIDKSFEYNIKNANRVGIDVGLYFFSYATNKEQAKENALFVLDNIKDYKVTLPISFDWENFSSFNKYHISFYELQEMANTFIKTIEDAGYRGMNYGSKIYLENFWIDNSNLTWLAHYNEETSYQGKYLFWQRTDKCLIDGINGPVDFNIMYN